MLYLLVIQHRAQQDKNWAEKAHQYLKSPGGNVSLPDLISDNTLNLRLKKIFGRPFPAIISQPDSGILGSLPPGMVDITEEMRLEEEK